MIDGLLWFDADAARPLNVKVQRVRARYYQKFGRLPDICYVNPAMLNGTTEVDGVRLLPADNRLMNEFWIGEEAGVTLRNGNEHEPETEAEQVAETISYREGRWCKRPDCGAEVIDPQATTCRACGYDGRD